MAQPDVLPSVWWILPFAVLLLAIACGPLFAPKLWARNYATIAVALGSTVLAYYLFRLHAFHQVLHALHEFIGFVALIGSLFVVSGGIHVDLKSEATPGRNAVFLLLGALAANL